MINYLMQGNYNRVAVFYDRLAGMIFGQSLESAHRFLLSHIPPGATILVVGGGTGKVLEWITQAYDGGMSITYVDSSEKMVDAARRRALKENKVQYITASILDVDPRGDFDVVITAFFLDNFTAGSLAHIFNRVHRDLKGNGLWLFADFEVNDGSTWWQRALLWCMYAFFRLLCNIEAADLPNMTGLFNNYQYRTEYAQSYFKGFIKAVVYRKS